MALSNSQYNAIMREYERLQSEDRREFRERLEKLYQKVPELRSLEKQAGVSAANRFRKAVEKGDLNVTKGFSEEIREIEEKKKILLRENGFSAKDMEMHYKCPDCRDTGFVNGEKCHCFQSKIIKLLYAQSNVDRITKEENFDSFFLDYYDNGKIIPGIGMSERAYMQKVLKLCREYTDQFKEEKGNILFLGNTGVGKTFLCNCIAGELLDKFYAVIYLTANELFECISKVRIDKTEDLSLKELYGYIFGCDLLIIDDLGTEMTNTWTASQFFSLINARLNDRKATVISTNLSMKSLRDIYSERVTSRITSGYSVIPLYGEDIRLKKKTEA